MLDRISTFAGSLQRDDLIQSMQNQMNQLTNEISSGRKTDAAGSMGTGAGLLYQLHFQADQQTALQTSATTAASRLDAIQTALTNVSTVAQNLANASQGTSSANAQTYSIVATQAQGAISQVLDSLNTQFDGSAVFAGDAAAAPMQAADAPGGPQATVNAVLSAAVAAKGGPLSQSDVQNLLNGANGLSSVFDNTNSNPALNYNGSFYTGATDGKPTKVLIGATSTLQYDANAGQPAFRDLMKGLSMLSMLAAPSSQLDDSAKSALMTQANQVISAAQSELTAQQGQLGVVQSQLQQVTATQQAAASATQAQIMNFEQADTFTDSTRLTALQTQLQATYEITAQLSQLSLTHYFPALG
ncbi:MAG: flagellin [Nevskiales bacterium]